MPAATTPVGPAPQLTIDALHTLLADVFPSAAGFGTITHLAPGALSLSLNDPTHPRHLRPGGTVSGPVLFTMVDLAFYLLVLSAIGPVPLAVTTSLNLNFLRRPEPGPLTAEARLLKLGQRLAVGDVVVLGDKGPVAHAQVTYSIPPPASR